jgi:hypothetical protein
VRSELRVAQIGPNATEIRRQLRKADMAILDEFIGPKR